jgi:hypothetical protein
MPVKNTQKGNRYKEADVELRNELEETEHGEDRLLRSVLLTAK